MTSTKFRPVFFDGLDLLRYLLDAVFYFRNQNHVRPARYPGIERDMTRIATHNLQNHDPVMRRCSGLKTVQSLCSNGNSRVKADRNIGHRKVIIDRFWNADKLELTLRGDAG
jgi:hypothetical protein